AATQVAGPIGSISQEILRPVCKGEVASQGEVAEKHGRAGIILPYDLEVVGLAWREGGIKASRRICSPIAGVGRNRSAQHRGVGADICLEVIVDSKRAGQGIRLRASDTKGQNARCGGERRA